MKLNQEQMLLKVLLIETLKIKINLVKTLQKNDIKDSL